MTAQASGSRPGSGDTLWKVVLGCGLAFGLLLLVGTGLGIYGVYWALHPGRQMPTALVVGPRSVGVVRLERGDSDMGMQELAESVLDAIQRAQLAAEDDKLPPFIQSMRRFQLAQGHGNLGMWIPREATLSIEAGSEEDESRTVAAVNMRGLVRPMGLLIARMMRGEAKTRVLAHGDHEVIVNPGGSAVSFAEGTLLFGSGAPELTAVLDRWGPGSAAAPPLPASVKDLSGRFDVFGALHRSEEARAFLGLAITAVADQEKPGDAESARLALTDLQAARFGIDARTADEAQVFVELTYVTPAAASAARQGLAVLLSEMPARAMGRGASLVVKEDLGGPRLGVEMTMSGIETVLYAWAAELMRREK